MQEPCICDLYSVTNVVLGSGRIWMDDLVCEGTETSLVECKFKGWGLDDCSHDEDAGVKCETGMIY